jgi:hypothetical protein
MSTTRRSWGKLAGRLVLALVLLAIGGAYGFVAYRKQLFPYDLVRYASFKLETAIQASTGDRRLSLAWREAPSAEPMAALDPGVVERLDTLGYLAGYTPAPPRSGVTRNTPALTESGLNLYVSGHDSSATLMTMSGEIVHSWRIDFSSICPDEYAPDQERMHFFRRARLLEDGSLLAIFDYAGLVKLDKSSNPVWFRCKPYHHDFDVADDGTIVALMRQTRQDSERYGNTPVLDDEIHILSAEGEVRQRYSLLDSFASSDYAPALTSVDREDLDWKLQGDLFHTNAVKLIGGSGSERAPAFSQGNILLTIRNLDTIAILDPEQERLVWALSGMWHRQHEAVLLPTGNILVFDNLGMQDHSRVIELDPLSQTIEWLYDGDTEDRFFSFCCGSNQRLTNGNTLITDTWSGRSFEVTADKQIVWEFWNPHRAGKNQDLIACLFDLVRLPADQPLDWLD